MDDFKKFLSKYWGGILGAIIAIILACTGLYKFIVVVVLIVLGIWLGNYFQHNKNDVKTKLKNFIDKW